MNPYTLEQAQEAVRDALTRSCDRHDRWRALEALYRTGDMGAAKLAEAGKLTFDDFDIAYEAVNMVLPHINVILASSVARDPKHTCTPQSGGMEAEDYAGAAEGVLDYFWKRTRGTQALRKASWDMVVSGNGFLKVGWHHLEHEEDADEVTLEERLVAAMEDDRLQADLEEVEPAKPEDLVDRIMHTTTVTDVDEPFVEYVPPYDVFVPPNAVEIEDCRWVCHRVSLPIDEVEDNPQLADVDLTPDTVQGGGQHDEVAEWVRRAHREEIGPEHPMETVTIFEFYDMAARRLLVFQLDGDEPLYDDELPYAHRYPPIVHLRNYQASGTDFWGFGDVENVANLQQMLNELFTEQMDNARRAGNKTFVDRKALDANARSALESDESDVAIPVDVPNGKTLQEIVYNVERHALSGDVYAAKEDVQEYLRLVLGINDFQAGGVGADRMSATAAAVVDGVASLRALDKVGAVEDGAAKAGNLKLLLCQQFLEEPRAIRVAKEQGATWPEVSLADIRGEFLVSVEGGSTKSENPQTRENRGLRTLNEVIPALEAAGFDTLPAWRQAMRDLGYDPDLMLQQLPPEPPPEPDQGGGGMPEGMPGELAAGFGEGAPAQVAVDHGGPPQALEAQLAGDML